MCSSCGCDEPNDSDGHRHAHGGHRHEHGDHGRAVRVERNILEKNDAHARENRRRFSELGVVALNLVSSPGAGKTTLLVETITRLAGRRRVAVIEGDQQTTLDADRIRATGAPAVQINTGKGCHLDAHAVGHAVEELDLQRGTLLFIENVGNLVCPAAFDLGEAHKVLVLSVTEGDDKPLKYPDMFAAADLLIVNKTDLLPHVRFDLQRCSEHARRVNGKVEILHTSTYTGDGLANWLTWVDGQLATRSGARAGGPSGGDLGVVQGGDQ